MAHKRLDKTFSTCDIIRIWYENLTDREQNEIVVFFTMVVPNINPTFNMVDLLAAILQRPSLAFGQVADSLGKLRIARRLRSRTEIAKVFTSPGSADCVFDFVLAELRQRFRA